jgi:hypothetical protein
MKKILILTFAIIGFLGCKKKEVEMKSTSPEIIFLKLVNTNGIDLINGTMNPVLVEDISLEYLIDGKRVIPSPISAFLDKPEPPLRITSFYNPNVFNGKIISFYPNISTDQTTLKSTSYLTIRDKGTYKVEVELIKAGFNATNGKVWVDGVLLREDRTGGDKPITLQLN